MHPSSLLEGAGKRKRRLFSNDSNYLADSPGSVDMFATRSPPPGRKRPKAGLAPTVPPILEETVLEPPSTQEFAAGLRVSYHLLNRKISIIFEREKFGDGLKKAWENNVNILPS